MNIIKEVTQNFATNVYLVTKDKRGILIDPGEKVPVIEKHLKDNEINLDFILLTHGHMDHIGYVDYYRKKYDIPVYGGKEEEELLLDPKLNLSFYQSGLENLSIKLDRTLKDGEIFSDFNIRAIHTPGHTSGGYSYLIDDHLFTGDSLFYQSIGRTDFPSGNQYELISSIQNKLFIYSNKTVHPGHDRQTSIDYEKTHNPYLN